MHASSRESLGKKLGTVMVMLNVRFWILLACSQRRTVVVLPSQLLVHLEDREPSLAVEAFVHVEVCQFQLLRKCKAMMIVLGLRLWLALAFGVPSMLGFRMADGESIFPTPTVVARDY